MLKSDELKLKIVDLLKNGDMTLGELRRATKVAHHYTLTNALEFLKKLDLIEIVEKKDKLKTKIAKIKR